MLQKSYLIILLFVFVSFKGNALQADTVALTIKQADSIFLHQNLQLLAGLYEINARDAYVIQAKAYPNPVFTATLNAIDPQNDKIFHIGPTGQKEFEIEQLLILGGKRKSGIAIARQQQEIAKAELADVLRNLKLQLHASLYLLNKHRIILSSYDNQLAVLEVLIHSYQEQADKGNLPIKDVIRLKSVHLRIANNRMQVIADYLGEVKRIQTLLQITSIPIPVIEDQTFRVFEEIPVFDSLLDSAMTNRPDYKMANLQQDVAAKYLRLQKQLAIPDMVLYSGYDQQGGAFRNQIQVGVAIPLPLWNRNKGNIRAAQFEQLKSELIVDEKQHAVHAEVLHAWAEMRGAIREYTKASSMYSRDFSDVFNGVNENFRRRNISILEFVDFFEAYNESLADFQRIRTQLALSAEQVNHVTASSIY